jgi:hypothetical protein
MVLLSKRQEQEVGQEKVQRQAQQQEDLRVASQI